MSQCAYADEVDTLLGIIADGIEGDATTRLGLVAMIDNIYSLLGVGHTEVVEHDAVYASVIQYLLKFIKRAHLDLDLKVQSLLVEILVATVDSSRRDTCGNGR